MYVKILSLFVILIITILCGFLPKYISTHSSKKSLNQFLGIANAFSGGIFIGIAFFHLLPESAEGFEQYFATFETKSKFEKFPFYFLFAFLSYTLVLFVEKIAFDSHSLIDHNHGENSSNKENDSYFDKSIKTNEKSNRIENVHDHDHNHEIKNDHDHNHNHEDENHNHNHDHDNNHSHHNNNDSPSKIKAKNITTNKRFQTIGEKTDINITFKNSSEEKLKEIEDYKNLIGTDNNMVSNNLNEPLIIKNKDKSLTFKQSFNCINQAFKNDMYNEYGPEVYKKVFEDDENADSEDEEEIIKYVIGNKGKYAAFLQMRQLKSNF